MQALDLDAHLDPQLGVEIGQRFIEQEDFRISHDRTAHGHALALAARQLARLSCQKGSISSSRAASTTAFCFSVRESWRRRRPNAMFWATVMCG